jgi:hypothetical protein
MEYLNPESFPAFGKMGFLRVVSSMENGRVESIN